MGLCKVDRILTLVVNECHIGKKVTGPYFGIFFIKKKHTQALKDSDLIFVFTYKILFIYSISYFKFIYLPRKSNN